MNGSVKVSIGIIGLIIVAAVAYYIGKRRTA